MAILETFPAGSGVPAGGTQGQQLVKNSSTDGDASWTTVYKIPAGGSANQALVKNSSTSGDTKWKTITEAHTIKNSSGTAMTQRTNLEFDGLDVTDDSTNNITKVAGVGLNSDSLDDIADASLPSAVVMGSGLNYSTTEQIVGRWIDGKPIYQKVVDCGTLTTTSSEITKTVAHGISNLDIMLSTFGVWVNTTTHQLSGSVPFSGANFVANIISQNSTDLTIYYRGSWSNCQIYAILQYIKTTN